MQYKGVLKVLILIAAAAKVGDIIRSGQQIVRRVKRSTSCPQCRSMDASHNFDDHPTPVEESTPSKLE